MDTYVTVESHLLIFAANNDKSETLTMSMFTKALMLHVYDKASSCNEALYTSVANGDSPIP